jgi:UDP-3-O-[3-hydroxymyristoyl] glucosamine N-acyltransferase
LPKIRLLAEGTNMSETRSWTLEEVAAIVGGKIVIGRPVSITGAAGIDTADRNDVTFYEDQKFLAQLKTSPAAAVLVSVPVEGVRAAQIQVEGRPYLKFIELIHAFHPPASPAPGVDPTAVVDPDAG